MTHARQPTHSPRHRHAVHALLESQLTELHGLCMVRVDECDAAGSDSLHCYDLHGLSGHVTLLNLILKRDA